MPLRDHFHPPFTDRYSWDMVHGGLPMDISRQLNRVLPAGYQAGPAVNIGSTAEVDIGGFQLDPGGDWPPRSAGGGGVAVAAPIWAPPEPGLSVEAEWSRVDDYEVKVYDVSRRRELVAAIEIVSPSNKDRPSSRGQFAAKCAALLANRVSVVVIDFVTERTANLYGEVLQLLDQTDPTLATRPPLYAVACRSRSARPVRRLETWYYPLTVGGPLPTLPIWLSDRLVVPLELESVYEYTLEGLGIK
ncbi:MAG: DUF4058 family protein [Fimbriiglobus sp.]